MALMSPKWPLRVCVTSGNLANSLRGNFQSLFQQASLPRITHMSYKYLMQNISRRLLICDLRLGTDQYGEKKDKKVFFQSFRHSRPTMKCIGEERHRCGRLPTGSVKHTTSEVNAQCHGAIVA